MFKPQKLKKFSVITLVSDIQGVLDSVHENDLIEIRKVKTEEKGLDSFDFSERERFASFQLTRVKRALNFFSAYAESTPLKEQLKAALFGEKTRKAAPAGNYSKFKKKTDKFLEKLSESVEELDRNAKKTDELIASLEEEKHILESIRELNIDLSLLHGYERITVVIGKIAPEFEDEFLQLMKETRHARLIKITGEREKTVLFSVENQKMEELMRELRKLGFDRMLVPEHKGKVPSLIREITTEIKKLRRKKEALAETARELGRKNTERLLVLQELLEIEKSKGKAFTLFGKTEKTVLFEAFVPVKKEHAFREILRNATKGRFYMQEEAFNEEEAPVKLSNPRYFRDYEFILKMYGLPEYGSVDPTPFIAILFPVFFGIAFSDIGYGLLLTGMAIFLLKTLGKKDETWHALSSILLHGGIATIFFGWVFGGFFGDLLGESIKKIALLDPLGKTTGGESAALLFIGAITLVGLLHLNLAIILGFREDLRKKRYKMALADKLVYIILEGSILLYVLGAFFFHAEILSLAGMVLLLVSLILMFVSGGPLGLMKITGFMGNTLSYLRLVALSLATFAVAMSVNIIAGLMFGVPYVGFIIGIIVLVAGHLANFVFNILSSFIHPLRLHCVEFFSYFYSGTGKEFQSFHVPRKYTKKPEVK